MNKEMLEEYVLEVRGLREQVEILLRILRLLFENSDAKEFFEEIYLDEILATKPLPVRIEDGMAHLG